jgi:N-acetylmuramoyl-L-alanine amidase
MAITIGLDPGHGGSSSGTYSINSTKDGLFEEHYTLEVALLVEKILNEHGFKTVLTRRTDVNPGSVNERAEMLAEAGCDFCLSIHFNGMSTEAPNGTEVFVPYGEKGAGIEAGFLKYLGEFFNLRKPFARANSYYNKNDVFDKKLNVSTRKFEAVSSQKDYFGFVRTAWGKGVSADLLEICFLTNRKDFETFTKNKEKIAEAIARAIIEGYKVEWKPKLSEEPKEPEEKKGRFRVVAGSYDYRSNAEARKQQLEAAGFTAWILEE